MQKEFHPNWQVPSMELAISIGVITVAYATNFLNSHSSYIAVGLVLTYRFTLNCFPLKKITVQGKQMTISSPWPWGKKLVLHQIIGYEEFKTPILMKENRLGIHLVSSNREKVLIFSSALRNFEDFVKLLEDHFILLPETTSSDRTNS